MVMDSNQPWPRVMRRLPVRGRRSVDRGRAGPAIELRNHLIRVADLVTWWGRQYDTLRYREWRVGPAESENRSMYANSLHGNREIPGVTVCHPQSARSGKVKGRTPDMYAPGKSDGGIVSMKRMNKGAQSRQPRDQPPAEFVEKRPPAKGNSVQAAVTGTQRLEAASIGLSRVREAAKNQRFCV
jgi:hypothetical protein